MPFSHHSHSGQFCPSHAKNSLDEVIQTAIRQRMRVFCLSEHMPRDEEDFYPDDLELGTTVQGLLANEAAYFTEAQALRKKYATQINIPIGFETEWIRPPASLSLIQSSLAKYPCDFFVGSVHHVHTFPIDYDGATYRRARDAAGGSTDERLFADYFDAQLEMLEALRPPVVGHLDLIRLKSDDPSRSFRSWPGVWAKIVRNLDFIAGYGGIVELNSAGLRKGLEEPYPQAEICEEFLARNGRFCLSDDSHGVDQVGTNYSRMLEFIDRVGFAQLHYLEYVPSDSCSPESASEESVLDSRFPRTRVRAISVAQLKREAYWN